MHCDKGIIAGYAFAVLANLVSQRGDRSHHRIFVGEEFVLQTQRVHLPYPIRERSVDQRPHHGLHKGAVEGEVCL